MSIDTQMIYNSVHSVKGFILIWFITFIILINIINYINGNGIYKIIREKRYFKYLISDKSITTLLSIIDNDNETDLNIYNGIILFYKSMDKEFYGIKIDTKSYNFSVEYFHKNNDYKRTIINTFNRCQDVDFSYKSWKIFKSFFNKIEKSFTLITVVDDDEIIKLKNNIYILGSWADNHFMNLNSFNELASVDIGDEINANC